MAAEKSKPKNKPDPRSVERQVKFADFKKVKMMDSDDTTFEITALLAMLLSILGAFMEWKLFAWISFIISFINISNFRPGCEVKQIFSSILISLASLYILYMKDPSPVCDSIF